MPEKQTVIAHSMLERFPNFLREEERSKATLRKYAHDFKAFAAQMERMGLVDT